MDQRDQHISTLFLTYAKKGNPNDVVDYTDALVSFSSHYALLKVVEHTMKSAFQQVVENSDTAMASYYGAKFEDLVCAHLLVGGNFKSKALDKPRVKRKMLNLKEAQLRYVPSSTMMWDEMCKKLKESTEVEGERTLSVAPKNFALVDFIDSDGRWFNATMNLQHPVSVKSLENVLNRSNTNGGTETKVDWYWCVPDTVRFKHFQRCPVPVEYEHRVQQHAFFIPSDLKFDTGGMKLHTIANSAGRRQKRSYLWRTIAKCNDWHLREELNRLEVENPKSNAYIATVKK